MSVLPSGPSNHGDDGLDLGQGKTRVMLFDSHRLSPIPKWLWIGLGLHQSSRHGMCCGPFEVSISSVPIVASIGKQKGTTFLDGAKCTLTVTSDLG